MSWVTIELVGDDKPVQVSSVQPIKAAIDSGCFYTLIEYPNGEVHRTVVPIERIKVIREFHEPVEVYHDHDQGMGGR